VAIIGGGIGGLALGIACWHRNIPFTIYERDTSFRQRQQGYGLTLQQASKALKGFGIELEGGITSTRHVVHTPDGEEIGEWGLRKWGRDAQKSVRRQNVHIARQALREQLLNGVGNQVEWDHQLVSLKETDDKVELTFSQTDGTTKTAKADLVVGADGIRSTIRNLMIDDTKSPLRYLGCIVILGICPLDAIEGASESELLDGHTVFQTADGTTRLYCMPFSSTEYMWQLSYPVDEKVAIATSREKRLKTAALEKCGEWHSPLPQLLNATPPELVSGYPVYDRALLETEMLSSSNRITLLGDSAQ
jgi:2-polyprenyl-6-methoxyphenol hydroxylase-like FAD-dependent oxidoreductase